jgi:predicted Zn-dependent protease
MNYCRYRLSSLARKKLRWLRLSCLIPLAAAPMTLHAQGLLDRIKKRVDAGDVLDAVLDNREAFQGFSEADEQRMAQENAAEFEAQAPLWNDPALDQYLSDIVDRLATHAEQRSFDYRIRVVATPDVNAFTFGGGYLYVYAGLLALMNNEAQLAMVLGHEVAHVAESHVPEGIRAQAGINILGQLAGQAVAESGELSAEALQAAYSYSMNAAVNGHGRRQEREADELGLQYLVEAGYDPQEGVRAFEQLLQEFGDPDALRAFFYSDHPRTEDRLRRTTRLIESEHADALSAPDLVVNEEEYQRMTRGIRLAVNDAGGAGTHAGHLESNSAPTGTTQPASKQTPQIAGNAEPQDHPLISRFPGSTIVQYDRKNLDEQYWLTDEKIRVEGRVTRIAYQNSKEHSTLEIFRSYQNALRGAGFEEVFACQRDQCPSVKDYLDLPAETPIGRSERFFEDGRRALVAKRGDDYVLLLVYNQLDDHVVSRVRIVEGEPQE